LLLILPAIRGGNVMSDEKEYVVKIPDFRTQASENMSDTVDQAVKSYREIIDNIMGQLHQGGISNESKTYTVYMLGQLRAVEAVTVLLENIDLKASKVDPKGGIGRWGMYPAQEALSKIGQPAVNMILDKLPTERDELRRKLMCYVISDVEGKDFGKILVKLRIDQEQDPIRKGHLELALKILERL
jgi:hypothetical protein